MGTPRPPKPVPWTIQDGIGAISEELGDSNYYGLDSSIPSDVRKVVRRLLDKHIRGIDPGTRQPIRGRRDFITERGSWYVANQFLRYVKQNPWEYKIIELRVIGRELGCDLLFGFRPRSGGSKKGGS